MHYSNLLGRKDMIGCVLCKDAPCTAACGKLDAGNLLRSIWFDNEVSAAEKRSEGFPSRDGTAPCESAYLAPSKVGIRSLMIRLDEGGLRGVAQVPQEDWL